MSKVIMISSDCHAGALPEGYKPYLPSEFHAAADIWWLQYAREMMKRMGTFFDQQLEEYIANKNDRLHVRRKALEVLADLGDRGSVQALQDAGLDQDQELFETFYWMTNAIYQRVE